MPDQTDAELIAEIAERLAKATPGPWTHRGPRTGDRLKTVWAGVEHNGWNDQEVCYCRDGANARENAAFIAAAPTDIAWLLKLVERQRQWIQRAEERMQYMSESLRSDVL